MHPIISQALAAERIREWRDQAARDRLAKQVRQRAHAATASAELPGPRPGTRRPAPQQTVPVIVASSELADDGRQPAGRRAA